MIVSESSLSRAVVWAFAPWPVLCSAFLTTRREDSCCLAVCQLVEPDFANFNLVTPYPGTPFYEQVRDQIASFDFSRYDVYSPVLRYEHLSADDVSRLQARAFAKFYFRPQWLAANAALVWPRMRPMKRLLTTFGVSHGVRPSSGGASHTAEPIRGTASPGRSRRVPNTKGRGSPLASRS